MTDLQKLFEELEIPRTDGYLSALTYKPYDFIKVAIDHQGFPIILIASQPAAGNRRRNIKLKYIEMTHDVECRVTEFGDSKVSSYTIVIFKSDSRNLQSYFLEVADSMIRSFPKNPSSQNVYDQLSGFIEVFSSMGDPPLKTIQGLWAELFVINSSKDPSVLLTYWHNEPEEKFDFNSGIEKVEVKSSTRFDRIHSFSSPQLNPPEGTEAIIASLFVSESSSGIGIQEFVSSIKNQVTDEKLIEKLYTIIGRTLGGSLELGMSVKFDEDVSSRSLKFFEAADVGRIDSKSIPACVSNVRYSSDLTSCNELELVHLMNRGILFRSL